MSNNKYPGPYLPPPTGSNPPQSHHFASQGYQAYQAPENVIHRGQTMEGGGTGQALYGNGPNIEIGIDLPLVSSLMSVTIVTMAYPQSPDLQSPGHDSVSSSVTIGSQASSGCRNSTTSTDSGRGSSISTSSTTRPTNTYGHQHR